MFCHSLLFHLISCLSFIISEPAPHNHLQTIEFPLGPGQSTLNAHHHIEAIHTSQSVNNTPRRPGTKPVQVNKARINHRTVGPSTTPVPATNASSELGSGGATAHTSPGGTNTAAANSSTATGGGAGTAASSGPSGPTASHSPTAQHPRNKKIKASGELPHIVNTYNLTVREEESLLSINNPEEHSIHSDGNAAIVVEVRSPTPHGKKRPNSKGSAPQDMNEVWRKDYNKVGPGVGVKSGKEGIDDEDSTNSFRDANRYYAAFNGSNTPMSLALFGSKPGTAPVRGIAGLSPNSSLQFEES